MSGPLASRCGRFCRLRCFVAGPMGHCVGRLMIGGVRSTYGAFVIDESALGRADHAMDRRAGRRRADGSRRVECTVVSPGIKEQGGAVRGLIPSCNGLKVAPRSCTDVGIIEDIPLVSDHLEAVVVARVKGWSAVNDQALQQVPAYTVSPGPAYPIALLEVVIETYGRGQADALGLLANSAGLGLVCALDQVDSQAGGESREAWAPCGPAEPCHGGPRKVVVEEVLDGEFRGMAAGEIQNLDGQHRHRGGLQVRVAPHPNLATVPWPGHPSTQKLVQVSEQGSKEECCILLAAEGKVIGDCLVERACMDGPIVHTSQGREGLAQESAQGGSRGSGRQLLDVGRQVGEADEDRVHVARCSRVDQAGRDPSAGRPMSQSFRHRG